MVTDMRDVLRFWVPHGIVELHRRAIAKSSINYLADAREVFHAKRYANIKLAMEQNKRSGSNETFTFEGAITFLKNRGLNEHHLREGTIPAGSLDFIAQKLVERAWPHRPMIALHIGNYVGVSLAALVSIVTTIDRQSLVIAVDPNVPHRGTASPQDHVMALLAYFGFQANVIPIVGYSVSKSISNDGIVIGAYDPAAEYRSEISCENVINNLSKAFGRCIDLALIDGNHQASYLQSEIDNVELLLRPGGLIILDDVNASYDEIKGVYTSLGAGRWSDLGTDGRVGLLGLPVKG